MRVRQQRKCSNVCVARNWAQAQAPRVGRNRKKGGPSHEELLNSDDPSESMSSVEMSSSHADSGSSSESSDYLLTNTGLVPIEE